MTTPVLASTGMGNCREEPTNQTAMNKGIGLAMIMTMMKAQMLTEMDQVGRETPTEEEDDGDANCWGKVTSSLTQERRR